MLDAEYHNVSRSGATISSLNSRYDRIAYGSANPKWTFSNFPADVVVVNLGANDVGKPKGTIKSDYHAFLDDSRLAYPGAHIMLFNAWGWDYDEPANYIHEVIAERTDPRMSSAIFPWLFEQWPGCEYDHAGMAQILADHLTSTLGWSQSPTDIMSGYGRNGDVANGSFEEVAPLGGYGWRYYTDSGVSRVHAPGDAFDGDYYLRLSNGAATHQPIPAVDGESFTVTVWMRGDQDGDQVDIDGVTMLTPVGVGESRVSPHAGYGLVASPNPFDSATRIAFRLPRSGPVVLTLYDVSGRQVANLIDGHHETGEFVTRWDGRDQSGGKLSSGIYFLRISAGGFTATKRLVLHQ
jgi:hypothetical protein